MEEVIFFEVNFSCINEDVELVLIGDFEELCFFDEFLRQEGVNKIYVGMIDIVEEDRWVWMDGSFVILDFLWYGNYLDGGINENCGEYVENYGFYDKKCEKDKRYYVCKYLLYYL